VLPIDITPTQTYEGATPNTEPAVSEIPHIEIGPKEITQEITPQAPTEFTESKTFQPLESVASGSAAVSALVMAANEDSQAGKMDSAVATMERAIRLEPRNPTLLYKLAVLRLQQSKPAQAEDLAKKAALLASKDAQLKKHSWLLIARAREMQHDVAGAQEARDKANSF
jgi:predicted Zn-dependent protease